MRALHLCFWLHRPYELLGAGKWEKGYFGGEIEFKKADQSEYQPLFALLERNAQRYPKLKVSLVMSGVWLEQVERWDRDLLRRLQKLVANGNVEPVITPYYYSMVAFYDFDELKAQIIRAQEKFEQLFEQKSISVALPELCYQNRLARWMEKLGFQVMLAGDATKSLDWRTCNRVYDVKGCQKLRVMFMNRKLSEMIAQAQDGATVRTEAERAIEQLTPDLEAPKVATAAEFVQALNQSSASAPAAETTAAIKPRSYHTEFSAKKYQKQLDLAFLRGDIVTLSLEPAIFGQWREMGVIGFFDELFKIWLESPSGSLMTARDALRLAPTAEVSIKRTVSRVGETEKDYQLPDWWGQTQDQNMLQLMQLCPKILASKDTDLYLDFSRLTTLDYATGSEQYNEILADITKRLGRFVVRTADGDEKIISNELTESTAVKVKIKSKPKPSDFAENENDLDSAQFSKSGEDGAYTQSESDAEDIDDMEAAIQVMAQRMKRQSMSEERNVEGLAEAEVVSEDVRVDYEEAEFEFDDLTDEELSEGLEDK